MLGETSVLITPGEPGAQGGEVMAQDHTVSYWQRRCQSLRSPSDQTYHLIAMCTTLTPEDRGPFQMSGFSGRDMFTKEKGQTEHKGHVLCDLVELWLWALCAVVSGLNASSGLKQIWT